MEAAGPLALPAAAPSMTGGCPPVAGDGAAVFADLLQGIGAASGEPGAMASPAAAMHPPVPAETATPSSGAATAASDADLLAMLRSLVPDDGPGPVAGDATEHRKRTQEIPETPVDSLAATRLIAAMPVPDSPSPPAPSDGAMLPSLVTGLPTAAAVVEEPLVQGPAKEIITPAGAPTAAGTTEPRLPVAVAPPELAGSAKGEPPALPADGPSPPPSPFDPPPPTASGVVPAVVVPAASATTPHPVAAAPPPLPAEPPREQLRWQFDGAVQEAHLSLAPEGLGAIELHVQVEEGSVRLHLGASEAPTRELLSEHLPRLRERLGDSGLALGQASVSTPQDPRQGTATPYARQSGDKESMREGIPEPAPVIRRGQGLLDHYA